jgi:membrane dipeptidase
MPKNLMPVFDGHNDTLLDIFRPDRKVERSFFERSEHGHIDLPRARAGGFAGGFFAIYTPNRWRRGQPKPKLQRTPDGVIYPLPGQVEQPYALEYTVMLASQLLRVEAESRGKLKVVRTAGEIERCLKNNVTAAIMHVEGAEFVDADFYSLDVLHEAGLRSLGLVWSRPNQFGHGVPFNFPDSPDTGPGLTDLGKELVRRCNRLGILVDLSHLNEQGFWDVASISDAPLVTTHSGAHAMCPSPRNLTDKQLDAIRASGGMTGVNFHIGFLRADGDFRKTTSLSEIVRHVAYIAGRIGIDHVGLGSDFDGATMPHDLHDVAGLPRLIEALFAHGFDEASVRKIAYENWVRVLQQTWGK